MLYYNTIEPATLELLKKIQGIRMFSELCLVGGTGLALQYGHRKSIDLDLFGKLTVDEFEINQALRELGRLNIINSSRNIKIYTLNNIKLDVVNYPYKWLKKPIIEDNVKLADKEDIAAMKFSAITNRGTKKDFIDIYFLLEEFSLEEMINLYTEKYDDGSEFMLIKSLTYFDDAEGDPMPMMLKDVSWEDIKKKIVGEIKSYSGAV